MKGVPLVESKRKWSAKELEEHMELLINNIPKNLSLEKNASIVSEFVRGTLFPREEKSICKKGFEALIASSQMDVMKELTTHKEKHNSQTCEVKRLKDNYLSAYEDDMLRGHDLIFKK
ncbi:hypothetical protein PanWU01x14_208370 [Parasponia andersonii]|uniref:Uncharacterized protein n=1 Tax=Parasponia andersonii TaxID=3476 RepID=A0A2P5BUW8_PARAD|nr:hypothetical protein PanWU01x14_208370 [Parasponia andersonii]